MTKHDRLTHQATVTSLAHQAVTPPRVVAYVSAGTLAQLLDVSETTVRDWANRGIIPRPARIGGSVRWSWSEVEKRIGSVQGSDDENDPILKASRGC